MTPQIKSIEMLNTEAFDGTNHESFKLTVVDFMQTFGAEIDRETNRLNLLERRSSSVLSNKPNYQIY